MDKKQVVELIKENNIQVDVAIELGMEYIERDSIDDMFDKPSQLLDDQSNLKEVLSGSEFAYSTGSIYYEDYWAGADDEDELKAGAMSWIKVEDDDAIIEAYHTVVDEYK